MNPISRRDLLRRLRSLDKAIAGERDVLEKLDLVQKRLTVQSHLRDATEANRSNGMGNLPLAFAG
ncbi:MAG: hypothetical protein JWN67_1408 [Actinomycetia bacterium]|nr:hypothetical protein [Actinomycetes bacterium]